MYFNHINFNVRDIEKSVKFYQDEFDLEILEEMGPKDGSARMIFLGDRKTGIRFELTWEKERTLPYDLGETPFHFAISVGDVKKYYSKHKERNMIVGEKPEFGIYFIRDPDGYLIEIVP